MMDSPRNKGFIFAGLIFLACSLSVLVISCGDKKPTNSNHQEKWEPSSTGLDNLTVKYLAVHPIDGSIVFAGTFNGLYKSTNGAQTWVRVDAGWKNTTVMAIAFDAHDADVMYAGTQGAGIFKSQDGGESWQEKKVGLLDPTIWSVATDPNHADTLFVGTEGGIYRSFVGADSLAKVHWYARAFVAIDPENSQRIYAGGKYNNLHKSEDGGQNDSWFESSDGLAYGSGDRRIQWVLIDPLNPATLYVASNTTGVYKSVNAGGHWLEKNTGLAGAKDVRVLVLDFSDTQHLYAGTNSGVYQSTDGADSWEQMNEGLTNTDVRALAVDFNHSDILYAGTWGDGVFKREMQ